jgi:hypothetical protein
MREDTITMSAKEQQRVLALTRVCEGVITLEEAAELMQVSVRHARRLKAGLVRAGPKTLVHGNRGRPSPKRTAPEITEAVGELYRTRYAGTNVQHFTELLSEAEELHLSVITVRRILQQAGIAGPRTRRRVPAHRRRRERAAQEGMLLQLDGSQHPWLEDRGPRLTLVGAIDDATGTVPAAVFREHEDSQGYFQVLEQIARRQGVPLAVYHDGHGIFVRSKGAHPDRITLAELITGKPAPTQFGRLLEELGITAIPAHSPQAKGRVERLWGTFQDRLVTELRLADVRTLDDANAFLNAYLPRYNARFGVPPATVGSAYRPLPADFPFAQHFCFKYQRTVAADNTIKLAPLRIQLLPDRRRASYAKAKVEIQVRMDGAIAVYHEGRLLHSEPAPAEAPVLRIQGSRITYQASGPGAQPSRPLRPLPRDIVPQRLPRHSPEDAVVRAAGFPALPGPNHPWRKQTHRDAAAAIQLREQWAQARREAAARAVPGGAGSPAEHAECKPPPCANEKPDHPEIRAGPPPPGKPSLAPQAQPKPSLPQLESGSGRSDGPIH